MPDNNKRRKSFIIKSNTKRIQIGENIRVTSEQHGRLLQYIKDRLEFTKFARNEFVDRIKFIDRQVSGHIILDEDDKRRERDNDLGKSITPVDFNLQLTASQIDEAVTYLMSVLAPDEGMYGAITIPQKMEQAKSIITLMNKHADRFQHYRQMAKFCRDCLVYNFGGLETIWKISRGNRITSDNAGGVNVEQDAVIADGNDIPAIDPYNFLWDPSVRPVDLPDKGEFYCTVDLVTPFRLKKGLQDKKFWNVEEPLKRGMGDVTTKWYESRPIITYDGVRSAGGRVNWVSILTASEVEGVSDRHEIVRYVGWIIPKEFGLSQEKNMQIWELKMLNDQHIIFAKHLDNAHEKLPVSIGMPIEDGNEMQTKSAAEMLIPLQRFASQQLNIKQRADRKSLYGMIIYDEQNIPLLAKADLLGGKVPARPSTQDRDLNKLWTRIDDPSTTDKTLENVSAVIDLMQKLLPTDMLKQVTDLQRATQYQAAAAVQGGNRKNHKMAMLINSQALLPNKTMQIQNIYQFATETEVITKTGEIVKVQPSAFRGLELEWTIGAGLKGMDRLIVAETIKEVLVVLVQNREAFQQADVFAILDYLTDLLGDSTDFNGFKIKNPFDQLTPEQKQIAFEMFQQAQAQAQAAQNQNATGENQNAVVSLPTPR